MTTLITIKGLDQLERVTKNLGQLDASSRKGISQGIREWGNIAVRDLKDSARQAKIDDFTGGLQGNGIRWEQAENGVVGRLMIPSYGVMLDSMNPHWVSVTRQRTRLLAWANQANNSRVRHNAALVSAGKRDHFNVFVKPHPFIQTGLRRANPKLNPLIKNQLNKVIKQTMKK